MDLDLHEGPQELFDLLAWLKEQPRGDLGLHKRMTKEQRAWYVVAVRKGFAAPGNFWQITELGELALSRRQDAKRTTDRTPEAGGSASAVEAMLGDEVREILGIARSDQSADDRMRAICAIDRRLLGYKSTQWAELLGTTSPAVRKTVFWKVYRRKAIKADQAIKSE